MPDQSLRWNVNAWETQLDSEPDLSTAGSNRQVCIQYQVASSSLRNPLDFTTEVSVGNPCPSM